MVGKLEDGVSKSAQLLSVSKPGKTLLIIDGGGWGWSGLLMGLGYTVPGVSVSYRHSNGVNVLFVDGHVQWMPSPGDGNCLDVLF